MGIIERFERQELYCHACNHFVQFNLDLSLDGKHVLKCPNCDHEHYRIVENGMITADRWANSQTPVIYISSGTTATTVSTWVTTGCADNYLYASWTTAAVYI